MHRWINVAIGIVAVLEFGSAATAATQYTLTDLGTLGGSKSLAYGINDAGQVVGYSLIANNGAYHAFQYSAGKMTDIGSASVPGDMTTQFLSHIDASDPSREPRLAGDLLANAPTLGGPRSFAMAANNEGQTVGYSWTANYADYHAVLFENGAIENLDTFGGHYSKAMGLNDAGTIVGYTEVGGDQHAFIYQSGAMKDLGSMIDPKLNWKLDVAFAVNNRGVIVGWGDTPTGQDHAFLLTPTVSVVPEPVTGLSVLLGVGLITRRSRRTI